jgi:SAM-dependent methyltransferase
MSAFYKTSENYARQQASHPAEYFDRLQGVMKAVLTKDDPQIVEIGGGSGGAMHSFLSKRPAGRAVVVELSPTLLRIAQADGKSWVLAVAGTALQLPFRDLSGDAVVACEVIEHLPDVAQALDELVRIVRRPGLVIIGLPNHASLWTPIEDAVRRRNRDAFGVTRGRGTWRWWRRNAVLTWRKRLTSRAELLYRQPILDGVSGGDADAVYYAAPLDLMRFFRRHHLDLVKTSAELRLGAIGRWLPVELQGSTVLAWRTTAEAKMFFTGGKTFTGG